MLIVFYNLFLRLVLQSVDIVRPLCKLLNEEYSGIENFEALMALGNLASLNEATRKRILKVKKNF